MWKEAPRALGARPLWPACAVGLSGGRRDIPCRFVSSGGGEVLVLPGQLSNDGRDVQDDGGQEQTTDIARGRPQECLR